MNKNIFGRGNYVMGKHVSQVGEKVKFVRKSIIKHKSKVAE